MLPKTQQALSICHSLHGETIINRLLTLFFLLLTASQALASEYSKVFDQYLDKSHPIATAFLSTQDLPNHQQKVLAIADGEVVAANRIKKTDRTEAFQFVLRHVYFENAERKTIFSSYELKNAPDYALGTAIRIGTLLGQRAKDDIAFTLSSEFPAVTSLSESDVRTFLNRHQSLFNPLQEQYLILIDTTAYRMRIVRNGQTQDLEIGIGQAKGKKEFRGDNKTPRGMYFVTHKHQGEFSGPAAAYFGGFWIKLNYPNAFDAERGLAKAWVTEAQAKQIKSAWKQRKETLQQTNLGGGIGLHAWAFEWSNASSRHMSWGCVVLHPSDMFKVFDTVPVGAMVILL